MICEAIKMKESAIVYLLQQISLHILIDCILIIENKTSKYIYIYIY